MAAPLRILARVMQRIDAAIETSGGGTLEFLLAAKSDLQYYIDLSD